MDCLISSNLPVSYYGDIIFYLMQNAVLNTFRRKDKFFIVSWHSIFYKSYSKTFKCNI